MLGGFSNILGGTMKANNVGNAIDSKVEVLKSALKAAVREVDSFDDVEADMMQFANQLRQEAPQLANVFENLTRQINRKQGNVKEAITEAFAKAGEIDGLTDKIQVL